MSSYQSFIFEGYEFHASDKRLDLHYSLDGVLHFTETYRFNFDFADYQPAAFDRALQSLFFMAGISYYKTYLPSEIVIKGGALDQRGADFFSKTYRRGLGEFWYVNQLDPRTAVTFPVTASPIPAETATGSGALVGVGGGKDSLLSIEALRSRMPTVGTWSLGHQAQLEPLVDRIGLPHAWVERNWDELLLKLNQQGAYNGHIPISAIIACAGSVVAILSGRQDIIVSNEQAANEPTLTYQGVAINHQYSKSQEFERDYQAYLRHTFNGSVRYYSFLRPLSELYIGELFAATAFEKYKDVFSSCNRAFIHSSDHLSWCGECPKCAFVFMILTPFIERTALEKLWHGRNLLLEPALQPTYRQLLGIDGDKPLECVGEIKDSRAAMRLCQERYPELKAVYTFELPDDYEYHSLSSDEMPPEIRPFFKSFISG
jgi:hypothetical protein